MQRRWAIVLSILVVGIASVGVIARTALFGPADLDEVRARVIPILKTELAERGLVFGQPVLVRIFKESRELEIWIRNGETFSLFKTYDICAYSGGLGPKLKEGDKQSPEGFYTVAPEQMNPQSRYHLSFNLGFPNAYDSAHGRTGSFLMVHGNCLSIGCYAITDAGIEEVYLMAEAAFERGQPFFRTHIFPFRMTDENLARHAGSPWIEYWRNLKEGSDLFEAERTPPDVTVKNKRYSFRISENLRAN